MLFKPTLDDSIYLSDFHKIRSLRIEKCFRTMTLLKEILKEKVFIKLTSLELEIDDKEFDDEEPDDKGPQLLKRFLKVVQGLKKLHLRILNPKDQENTDLYWIAARRHQSSLRQFLYHERYLGLDPGDGGTIDRDVALDWNPSIRSILRGPALEKLGLNEHIFHGVFYNPHGMLPFEMPTLLTIM